MGTFASGRGMESPYQVLRLFVRAVKDWASSRSDTLRWTFWGAKPGQLSNVEEICRKIDVLLKRPNRASGEKPVVDEVWEIIHSMEKGKLAGRVFRGFRTEIRWFPIMRTEDGRTLALLEDRGEGLLTQGFRQALVETLLCAARRQDGMLAPPPGVSKWIQKAVEVVHRLNPIWCAHRKYKEEDIVDWIAARTDVKRQETSSRANPEK